MFPFLLFQLKKKKKWSKYQKFHRETIPFSPSPQFTDKPSNISFSTDIAKVYRARVYIYLNWNNKKRKKKKKKKRKIGELYFPRLSLDSTGPSGIHVSRREQRKIKKGGGEKRNREEKPNESSEKWPTPRERDIMQ